MVAFWCQWWHSGGMPNISLRLSDSEHELLREWAHGARRSMQREIVFRLFDGAVTEGDVGRLKPRAGVDLPVAASPSVTAAVPTVVHDVPVRAHMKRDMPAVECPTRVASGMCPDCGKYL